MSENERVDVAAPGTWEALTLLGLMRSRTEYRPVGPTDEFTLEAMRDLAALDLIEVPWPSLHWPENVTGDHTTYERFGWRLAVPRASEGIIALLEAALLESQTDPGRSSQWVKIWQRLAAAESIGFLGHQLDQLSMPWQWRQDATAPPHRNGHLPAGVRDSILRLGGRACGLSGLHAHAWRRTTGPRCDREGVDSKTAARQARKLGT
ncbi:MAG: hypothetical protein IPH50_02920 [Rhodanobacteraceae bacterium]|nr:hypothetical protein [Rhodanobacteraceae bacterium]